MPFKDIKFNFIDNFLKTDFSKMLTLNGLLAPFDLFLIKEITNKNKKVLFITQDEQTALKAQKDLEILFNEKSELYPFQEISFYSELEKN